jgi:hypothetical protein
MFFERINVMKVFIIMVFLFLSFPLVVTGAEPEGIQTDFTKPYVGFKMPISVDSIQVNPTCNKKPFYFGGTSYDWLNSDKPDISSTLFKTQEK